MADIVNYLQQINNAADDIEQIAKALKVLPKIEPYADNMLDSIIIIRANINCIQDIPHIYDKTVDVQPVKRGRWEENAGYGGWGDTIYQCSECNIEFTCETGIDIDWKYCPNCGARMEQEG